MPPSLGIWELFLSQDNLCERDDEERLLTTAVSFDQLLFTTRDEWIKNTGFAKFMLTAWLPKIPTEKNWPCLCPALYKWTQSPFSARCAKIYEYVASSCKLRMAERSLNNFAKQEIQCIKTQIKHYEIMWIYLDTEDKAVLLALVVKQNNIVIKSPADLKHFDQARS